MARNFRLWENAAVVSLLKPAADAAGRTSTYVSMRDCHKAYVAVYITQGNAATILLSVLQATDSAGTGSKAVSAVPIAVNLDTDTTPADQFTFPTAAATYTTDAGLKTKLVIFEILPESAMDVAGGFNHIAVSTGASNAANITSALFIGTPLRQQRLNPITVNA